MFDPSGTPRVMALPPGADFAQALVDGLIERCAGQPAEVLARVHIVVNTQRMARRVSSLLGAKGAALLPRVSLISDVSALPGARPAPPPTSALRRRLMLTRLIRALLDSQPDLAGRAAAFDLAGSLSDLIDEMHGEGVAPEALQSLDFGHLSAHWDRARAFIAIADSYLRRTETAPDQDARHRRMVQDLARHWRSTPPSTPILVAGSTGSRGTTSLLMQAVARLPHGAVVLPGFDFDMPARVWRQLEGVTGGEDHPQHRFVSLLKELDISPSHVTRWTGTEPPSPARARIISLSLRPAPYTDAWLHEGPDLPNPAASMDRVSLVEARSAREEALAIALRLRLAAQEGQTAALVSPDRTLTRQVEAALDRWNIRVDDSAGEPLHLTAPGRFLRQVAAVASGPLRSDTMMALLKHPLTHAGVGRGDHLRWTRDFELYLRDKGIPFPSEGAQQAFALAHPDAADWTSWITRTLVTAEQSDAVPLKRHAERLISQAEVLSFGSGARSADSIVWQQADGRKAREVCDALLSEADAAGDMSAREFEALLSQLLAQEQVRDSEAPEGRIMIWGTLDARVQGAELVILGGLNEGVWPQPAAPDPWLNRELRRKIGLLVPERQIGLSAHDYQQAVCAPEVWLTRAFKSDSAETVPSRWVNRLTNLLDGLPDTGGRSALEHMRDRGKTWLRLARSLDRTERQAPAPRPSPVPPPGARPQRITVTGVQTLIRDPYAIYAREVLRLRSLNPLVRPPDALLRGTVVHDIFEAFVRETAEGKLPLDAGTLIDLARQTLDRAVPWPVARALWLARVEAAADWFVTAEIGRQKEATPAGFEQKIRLKLANPDVVIRGRADRIDRLPDGNLVIYDYKTGKPPTEKEQTYFDKQLLIEAAMLSAGAWPEQSQAHVAKAVYIGLSARKEVPAPLESEPPGLVMDGLKSLLRAYFEAGHGFTSRRAVRRDGFAGDFDHLARFGEWDHGTPATRVVLT